MGGADCHAASKKGIAGYLLLGYLQSGTTGTVSSSHQPHLLDFILIFLFPNPSNATTLPPRSPSKPDSSASLLRRLIDIPWNWSSGRARKDLNNWIENHPSLLDSLRRYENDVVVRFNVSTPDHEAALRRAVDRMLLDVWSFTDNYTDIRLEGRRVRPLLTMLPPSLQGNHSILISDLPRAVAATYPSTLSADSAITSLLTSRATTPIYEKNLPKRQGLDDVIFQDYQPLSVITSWMRLLDDMYRGRGFVRMLSIGQSYEGRDIPALRVGKQTSPSRIDDPHNTRDTILVTGGFHAREWISTSTVNYVAWSFIKSMDEPMISKILEHFDIVFIPILNPDGYKYTWEVDRLWRKSRQPTSMSYCKGYDLDHAFGYPQSGADRQDEPCSDSYGGEEPFQAVEAARLADWVRNETQHGANIVGYLDLHSYSQQVLFPYSYSCHAHPPNMENLQEVAMNLAKHMRLSNGEVYTVASACEGAVTQIADQQKRRVEAGGGSAIDYIYHDFGARYSYQIKLRDTGSYGFLLPSEDIIPTGEEVFQAMKYFGDYLLGNNGHELAQDNPGEGRLYKGQENMDAGKVKIPGELRKRRAMRA
ncbi:hypothetical protein F5Y15DRAFT_427257 [Xylariaceae sp. FL0016]|nr:hypothetical protein F5Y15DRAFT_427257 [Xylariaceae sp. FL0016]